MEIGRRFDIAVDIGILMVFIVTVYMTKEFLSAIPLSIVLIYLLKPVYAGIFRLTRHEGLSSFFSLMVVFAVILAVLIGLSGVLFI
jgi:predicted PurR-regulated permease PerM